MKQYILKRILLTLPVALGVCTLVFFLIHLIPGDPVEIMLGESAQVADKVQLRRELGLDQPISRQYGNFLLQLLRGNLGRSLHTQRSVLDLVTERYPATIQLGFAAMLVAILLALPLGIASAMKQYSLVDRGSMLFSLMSISVPHFWLGPMLIIIFAVWLDWLPVGGKGGMSYLILPAITLGTSMAAILTRMVRSSLIETLRQEYITVARAKGLTRLKSAIKHALRNALIPVVTILGLQIGSLLTGSIITETIFAWPGIGRLTIQAIQSRDYPLVQGCILIIALSYVIINLLTDLTYALIDPRIRYGSTR